MQKWGQNLAKNKVGQRAQKQNGTQHTFLNKSCGVGSCALHEIDARSLLQHRARWWHQEAQFTTACCVSYVYILLSAISANVTLSHLSSRYLCLGSPLFLLRSKGSEDEARTDRTPCEMKTKPQCGPKEEQVGVDQRASKRRYEDERWWMIMKNETWWKMCKDFCMQAFFA